MSDCPRSSDGVIGHTLRHYPQSWGLAIFYTEHRTAFKHPPRIGSDVAMYHGTSSNTHSVKSNHDKVSKAYYMYYIVIQAFKMSSLFYVLLSESKKDVFIQCIEYILRLMCIL